MTDASHDYGKKMDRALAAVRRMHADVSKLMVDADGTIGKDKLSVFGNNATRDLAYSIRADYWMAKGVYRFYVAKPPADQTLVDALTVRFFDPQIEEPLLLVGLIKYELAASKSMVKYLKDEAEKGGWHLWYAFASWSPEQPPLGELLTHGPVSSKNVAWFKVIGVRLYSIKGMSDVVALMKRVHDAEVIPTDGAGHGEET